MIPKDHICFLIENVVDKLDFSTFDIRYSGAGHPAYHPRIICKLLTQSMIDKIRPSRAIARNGRENIVFMYLTENLCPDFRTISNFRKNNQDLLRNLFKITVSTANELGAIGLEQLSIDGSKLKACASNSSNVTKNQFEIIEQYVNNELKEGIKIDNVEDKNFKDCRGYDQLKEIDKRKIKSVISKYFNQIEKDDQNRISKINDTIKEARNEFNKNAIKRVSLSDPEARFMKNKKGVFEQSYNPQITVDHITGIIVANDVCNDCTDHNQLKPQIEQTEENCGELKEGTKITIDNGYYSVENIDYLNKKKLDGYIPNQEEAQKFKGKQKEIKEFDIKYFNYDGKNDEFICPAGQKLIFSYKYFDKPKNKTLKIYKGINCSDCRFNSECTKRKDKIRRIKTCSFLNERREMSEKMKTDKAKEIYRKRKQVVERVIGDYKENFGFRGFLTRRLNKVKNEFNLVCAAYNLKKIWIILHKMKTVY